MSDMSLFQHWSTLNAIDRVGDRMHAGLMSLATAQAGAMQRLGAQLDDGLLRIDQSMMEQNEELNRISGVLDAARKDMRAGFVHIADQMSGINDRLDRLEEKVSNPEETRAWERFNRAVTLIKKGYPGDAFENLKAAIENDGGPALRHIPKFQLLLGGILIGDTQPQADELIDYQAAHCAFRQASLHLTGEEAAIALCRAGAAAFLDGDDDLAIDTYLDALQIVDEERADRIKSAESHLKMYLHGNRYTVEMLKKAYFELGPDRYMHFEAVDECLQRHRGPGNYESYRRRTKEIGRVIDLDRYTRYELAKCYLNKGDHETAAEELRYAIDQDWSMVVLVATDPFYQQHASWAGSLIERYRKQVIKQIASTLPALTHICTGPTERNHQKIADRFMEEVKKISFDDLDPDLKSRFNYYRFTIEHGFQSNERKAVEYLLNALDASNIGLLDITNALESEGWYEVLQSCAQRTKWGLNYLEEGLDVLEDPSNKSAVRNCFFWFECTEEAKKRANESASRTPGLLSRLSGKKPARSIKELKEVADQEMMRFSVRLSEALKPEIELLRSRHKKTADIHSKAEQCLRVLNRCRSGQPRFFAPALINEEKGSEIHARAEWF